MIIYDFLNQEKVLFIHNLLNGCDFRLQAPEHSSLIIGSHALIDEKDDQSEGSLDNVPTQAFHTLTVGLCEGQKRVFYLPNASEAQHLLAALKHASAAPKTFSEKYLIDEDEDLMGKGSFGEVRKAYERSTLRETAVKIIDKRTL